MNPIELADKLSKAATPWPENKPEGNPSRLCWFGPEHRLIFQDILRRKRAGIYMELGSWTGAGSTEFVLKNFPFMHVICVDTFEGSVEHHKKPEYREIALTLWEHFCGNMWNHRHRVFPFRCNSRQGLRYVFNTGVKPDFIYVDAAHDEDSVFLDIQAAVQLFPDAIILGDDYVLPERGHPGVYNGVHRAIAHKLIKKENFRHIGRAWNVLPAKS